VTNVIWRQSVSRQAENPLRDDIALNLRRSTGNGRRKSSEIAIEPTAVVGIQVQRRVRTGERRVDEAVDPAGAEHLLAVCTASDPSNLSTD